MGREHSLAERLVRLSGHARARVVTGLSAKERRALSTSWGLRARPSQLAPHGDWSVWLILAGRGFGKTRTGAEWVANDVLDGALQILSGATRMVALASQPSAYGDALNGKLAEAEMNSGDFQIANGDNSGRKVVIASKSGIPVTGAGIASHVALLDTGKAKLLYVTTCPEQALVAGGEVSFDSWSVEIEAPL